MTIQKQPLYRALERANLDKGSITIDTRNCEPIYALLPSTGETLELPKGRITLASSENTQHESEASKDLPVKVISCPEDIVFEQKVYKKEVLMPTIGGYSIMRKEEIFEVGDIVSAERSSDDIYGITTSRNGYVGKVSSSYAETFELLTYSRPNFFDPRERNEKFDVQKKYFRLSSAFETLYGATPISFKRARYVSGKGNSIILPIKDVHIKEGWSIGELSDGSTICLNYETVFLDEGRGTVEETISRMSAKHPLKSTGHREARRIF